MPDQQKLEQRIAEQDQRISDLLADRKWCTAQLSFKDEQIEKITKERDSLLQYLQTLAGTIEDLHRWRDPQIMGDPP